MRMVKKIVKEKYIFKKYKKQLKVGIKVNGFIINEVDKLKKKYGISNLFDIVEGEGIIVMYEFLGFIRGYYNKYVR